MTSGDISDVNQFIKDMNKKYGSGSLFTMTSEPEKIDVIPTGSLSLDLALGVGGIPRGKITELYGSYGTGKTTLCFHMITEAQKLGLKSFFVDMESAMNLDYAKGLGIQLEDIVWSQPSSTEEALGAIEDAIRSGIFGLIILDSVAALVSLKELEDDLGSANVALTARALSNFLRRNKSNILKNNVALVFTNQLRDKIGGYMGGTTTPGGRAIKFYDEVEMSIRRVQDIKDAKEIIGHTAEISIKKNKVAVPFKSAQFDIIYGKGIDPYRDMIEVAKNLGVLTLKGSYYVYIDESLGQGKDNAAETVKNNPSMMEEIRKECFERINS